MTLKGKPSIFFVLLFLLVSMFGCEKPVSNESNNEYVKKIEQWKHQRLKKLKSPDSWLSLAGLYWLEEGENTFGTDSENDFVVYKEGIPGFIGQFFLKNGIVSFKAGQDVEVLHETQVIKEIPMENDSRGHPTVLKLKSLSWHIIKRGEKLGVRLKDARHPRFRQLNKIDTFPVDRSWRVRARLERFEKSRMMEIPTVLGTIEKHSSPGILVFQIDEKTFRLVPTGDEGELFVIFGDLTNTRETYGGGRFLVVEKPDETGHTWVDFNLAYNPPCVFSHYATCSLPPEQNQLPIRVAAGEKMVQGFGH